MRVESVFVVISFVCFFLSIYFAMLALFGTVDEQLRAQLLSLTTSFFVGGIVIAVLFAVLKIAARLFSQKDTRLSAHQHPVFTVA